MGPFVCPECRLQIRATALFVSRGKAWWTAPHADTSSYRDLCRHGEYLPNGTILGCEAMRAVIDPWLQSQPDTADVAGPSDVRSRSQQRQTTAGTAEISISDIATASYLIEARADIPVRFRPVVAGSFRDPEDMAEFQRNPGSTEEEATTCAMSCWTPRV